MIYVILNFKHMDILEQYKKQFPEESKPASPRQSSNEYGFFINLVMRLSGGRIHDETKANYVLLAAVGFMLLVIILTFIFSGSSSEGKARFSTVCFPISCPK